MTQPQEVFIVDGRKVAVHRMAQGDRARTVVLCHAAPGSGRFDPDPEQTALRRITLLEPNRPGYGGSDPPAPGEWSTVGGAADDIAAVLDRVGGAPFGVAGWSAGGRVALALAARRPDLVERVVVLATPAPNDQVQWIPPEQDAALEALRGLPPDAVHAALSEQLAPLTEGGVDGDDALQLLAAGDADKAALERPGAADRLREMLRDAYTQGAAGMVADIAGYCLQPWGFEPAEVRAKTLLLYGAADPVAGSRHGSWWQKQLPDARLEVVPQAGHLLILSMWGRALSHLAPGATRR